MTRAEVVVVYLAGLLALTSACGGRQVTSESSGDHNEGGTTVGTTPVPAHRCAYEGGAVPASAVAAPDVVQARIYRFIVGDDSKPTLALPDTDRPGWAKATAMYLLDSFGDGLPGTPEGLVRWLGKWSWDGKPPQSARRWAISMAQPTATLSELLTTPNPDNPPHGIGYMSDKEILAGRATIDRRGMMVLDQLLCMNLPQPPPFLMLATPPTTPGLTEREWHQKSIELVTCAACHRAYDPFGHAFGHFDRSGNYRDLDNGVAIDSSDAFMSPNGSASEFKSIDDLAPQLAESCEVARCIARSLLREAIDPTLPLNGEMPFTDEEVAPIATQFVDAGLSMRALVTAIVESAAFQR